MKLFSTRNASLIPPYLPARRRLLAAVGVQSIMWGVGLSGYSSASFSQGTPSKDKLQALTPQDFGAVGDGARDDTAAFKALAVKPGSYIRVPAGR